MLNKLAPIGVMDSGLGGLSVVVALQKVLPQEDIIYFGDTANCPYGNKSRDELLRLSGNMLQFLQEQGVKCVALACNTTSVLADDLRADYSVPIITVAESAADAIAKMGLSNVGLIATVSTVEGGIYPNRISAVCPDCKVHAIGSVNLARLVEKGKRDEIECEIRSCMDALLKENSVDKVILGCTHYPLVLDLFKQCYPNIEFIDPAPYQAICVREELLRKDMVADRMTPKMTVFTTGDVEGFRSECESLGLNRAYEIAYNHIDA